MVLDQQDTGVFIGLDVGKSGLGAVALDQDGKTLFDRTLPNDETRLRDIPAGLAWHGSGTLSLIRRQRRARPITVSGAGPRPGGTTG